MPSVELDYSDSVEAAPFLDPEVDDDDDGLRSRLARRRPWYQPASPAGIVGLMSLILFLMTLAGSLSLLPFGRLIEDVVCRKHYRSAEPVDEDKCKVDEVQAEFAWIGGLQLLAMSLVGLVVTFPYGALSDRIGRKPVFRLSFGSLLAGGFWSMFVLSRWETLSLRLMALSPLSSVFGGGISVTIAVIHSVIADATTERASGFIFLSLGAVGGGIAGPAISAQMMERWGPMVPLTIVGFVFIPAIFVATVFLPETLPPPRNGEGVRPLRMPGETLTAAALAHLRHASGRLVETLALLRSQRSVLLLLLVFFLQGPIHVSASQILAQLLSRRFHWRLAQTGYVFSARGVLTVAVLAALPAVSGLLGRRLRLTVFGRDLALARVSLLFIAAGSVLTGAPGRFPLAAGIVVSALGVGATSLARSLVAAYVDDDHTGRLFALAEMVDTLGSIVAAPTLTWAFDGGMRWGEAWMGLPFYLLGALSAVVLVALLFVRPPRGIRLEEGIEL